MTDFVCGKARISWAGPKQLLPQWELKKTLRIMKLTAILLFLTALQVSAKGVAQEKITLALSNASLEKVFGQIEAQTGFVFIYKDETIKYKKVSIQVTNASLEQALGVCLKGQALSYTIIGKSIAIKAEKSATLNESGDINFPPLIDVKGRVLNEKGDPVGGVTVAIKGSTNITSTDSNGEFSLSSIDKDAVLIFTHISMETFELKVSGKTELVINLKAKVTALGGVTVTLNTGYQQLPKERATGSFTQIDNKLFNEQVGTGAIERLQYISNGVGAFPKKFGNASLMVRGLSTLTTTIAKPLIILDNFQYQGDLNNINPNDIENVTILKDASAGSIWGAQAANGVIVITTKKGQFNQKTKVEINSNVTITDKPDLFYVKNINSSDFVDVETNLFNKGFYDAQLPYPQFFTFSPVVNILDKQKRGLISPVDAASQIDEFRNKDIRNDFDKYFYQKAINQQYSVNVRGGSNNIAWILSTGFDQNVTELDGKYKRLNVRVDNSYKILKNLEANTSVFFTQSKSTTGKPAYGEINTNNGAIPPYTQMADEDGNALPLYSKYNQSFIDTFKNGKLLDWKYYPLNDYKHIQNSSTTQDINAAFGLNYKLFDFLTFSIKYRYEKQTVDGRNLQTIESYYTRDLINTYAQIDATGKVTYKVPKGDILDLIRTSATNQNFRGQINFDKNLGNGNLITLLGYEISDAVSEGNNFRTYGYNGNILTAVNVDYSNTYPNIVNGAPGFIPNPGGFSKFDKKFVSFFGNGAYTFDNKYTLSASVRRDASNLFGVNTNDKWKPLWSVGAAWDISKETFYKTSLFPYLKFRVTYGYQGNVDPSKVAVTTIGYLDNNPFTLTPYSVVRNFENPDLKWEQVGMLNAGLEFATKKGIISGSIEFYQKKATDLYGQSLIDVTTGLGTISIVKNFGILKGNGIDLQINSINLNGQFKWTTNFIFNTYTDKITKLNDPASYYAKDVVGGSGFKAVQGTAPFAYFAYKWAKLDPLTGDPLGYLKGQVSKDYAEITNTGSSYTDAVYVGRLLPPIYGSLGNTFSWKNISLTARLIYKFGYYFQRESINYSSLVSNSIGHSDYEKRWQKPGDESITEVPSFVYPVSTLRESFYQNSEVLATRADHIRLQYINLSYDFFKRNDKRNPFDRVQAYVVVNNLGIIWRANKYGIDPEFNNSVPAPKSIALGLKASF